MRILILSTSLNPRSRSRTLAERAEEICREAGAETSLVDLRLLALPFCDAAAAFEHAEVAAIAERLRDADAVLIASPIYNYDVSASCKNLVELTGEAWENKVVGFLCTAGGQGSYMSVMSLANSLMLDFRCVIVPRFVYATAAAFREGAIADTETDRRVAQLCREIMRFAAALTE